MGEVYEAEELESGRHVALKLLSRSLATVDRARFMREGRLAAGISHPHTIYIYGTDEIHGIPVIAMELAPGGTLKDAVKQRGPLPAAQAVDAILQVVSGLEAAAEAGILHRDIKPSNCFVDADGTVKVGDFGLSISTLTTDERSLTMLGTVLGTPAFAPPEQLRGDDLDVRSEIYSVGATLYYLLLGRAAFQETNILRLVTQVAQQLPPPPRSLRAEIPAELSAVVMRCLAKRPADRYQDYDALRAALEPFSSAAPRPASPGVRFFAGLFDNLLLSSLSFPLLTLFWDPFTPGRREGMVESSLLTWIVDIVYYGVLEGLWGRSLGKQIFGLRVIDESRQRPGLARGVARAASWVAAVNAPVLAYGYAVAPLMATSQNTSAGAVLGFGFPILSLAVALAMFATARRANGFAGLHDLATATRVVAKRGAPDRTRSTQRSVEAPAIQTAARIGPYLTLDEPSPIGDPFVTAYDDRLRRRVWIRRALDGAPELPAERRALGRSTRLRWLSGRRTGTDAWDAYEALDGQLLRSTPRNAHAWSLVRVWILDLALEIRSGLADGSLPPLTIDRLWITGTGRMKLLDWPANTAANLHESARVDFASAQRFLWEVAVVAARLPLPLGAREFLVRLERGGFNDADEVVAEASALLREPASLSAARRSAHLVACALPATVFAVFVVCMLRILTAPMVNDPAAGELTELLQQIIHLDELPGDVRQALAGDLRRFQIYTAAKHRARIEDPATWNATFSLLRVNPRMRTAAERAVAAHPNPRAADVAAAEAAVRPYLDGERRELEHMRSVSGTVEFVLLFAVLASAFVGATGLATAFAFRGGAALRVFGAAVVTRTGDEAGRRRAVWRAFIAWSPLIVGIAGVEMAPTPLVAEWPWVFVCGSCLTVLIAGAVYAARHPERGVQDRLAGTWLVPR
jgi:uncharacterized RDD family membrane protein YckC